MSTILLSGMDDSTKNKCAAGIKRDTSFPDLKMAVQAFVNLVGSTSMPNKKDAMDIDQIGERESEESWEKQNWWGDEWGGEAQDDQGGLNSLKGPKGGCYECGGNRFQSDCPKGGKGKGGEGGK